MPETVRNRQKKELEEIYYHPDRIYCWAGGKSGGKGYPSQTVTRRNAGLDGSVSNTVRDRNIRRDYINHYLYKSHRGGLGK